MGTRDRRLELHNKLLSICSNVYYMAPADFVMLYPCIRYSRNNYDHKYADNLNYLNLVQYELILITEDPDSELIDRLTEMLSNNYAYRQLKPYVADNLSHNVFTIYL